MPTMNKKIANRILGKLIGATLAVFTDIFGLISLGVAFYCSGILLPSLNSLHRFIISSVSLIVVFLIVHKFFPFFGITPSFRELDKRTQNKNENGGI